MRRPRPRPFSPPTRVVALALALTVAPAARAEDASAGDAAPTPRHVRSVTILGGVRFTEDDLLPHITTKPGEALSPERVEADRRALEAAYHEDGFLLVDVSAHTTPLPLDGAAVRFEVIEGHRVRIGDVTFRGNATFSSRELVAACGLEPERGFGILARGYYTPGGVASAEARLLEHYRHHGFFRARVAVRRAGFDERMETLAFEIEVVEGPRFTVANAGVAGIDLSFPEVLLREEADFPAGVPYSHDAVVRSAKRIRRWYLDRSDLVPTVVPRIRTHDDERTVDVVFSIEEGRPLFVGDVEITGNWKTRDRVIRSRIRLAPGDLYDPDAVTDTESLLRASRLFESVRVEERPTDDPGVLDLAVEVEEIEKTLGFELGGGASSGAGEIAYFGLYSENFDLFRPPASWSDWRAALAGGGQKMRIDIVPGTRESHYAVQFIEPWFFSSRTALEVSGQSQIYRRETYRESRFPGEIALRQYLDRDHRLSARLGYRAEGVRIGRIEDATPDEIAALEGSTFLAYPRLSVRWDDTRVNRYSGARGTAMELTLDVADSITGSEVDFVRTTARGDVFVPLFGEVPDWAHSLHFGLGAGWIRGLDSASVPIWERDFLGGPRSFRGFDYRRLGPVEGETPLGGQLRLNGTVEYSVPLFLRELRGVVLFDWGALSSDPARLGAIRTALGAGVQLRLPSPLGGGMIPVNLYWTRALSTEAGDETELFGFTLGFGF